MKTKYVTKKRQLVTDGIDTSSNYQQKEKHSMPWTDVSQNMVKKIIVKINGNRLLQMQYSNYCKYTRSKRDPISEGNTS